MGGAFRGEGLQCSCLFGNPSSSPWKLSQEGGKKGEGVGAGKKKNGIRKAGVLKEGYILYPQVCLQTAPTARLVSKLEDLSLKKLNSKLLR